MDPHYAMCGDCWERELKRRETERDHALDDLKAEISNHREDEARIRAHKARIAELEAMIVRIADPADLSHEDAERYWEIHKRIFPQNYE